MLANFLHKKNKLDIVRLVRSLTERRPVRSFSPGAVVTVALVEVDSAYGRPYKQLSKWTAQCLLDTPSDPVDQLHAPIAASASTSTVLQQCRGASSTFIFLLRRTRPLMDYSLPRCARSSASGRSHTWVLPPGTLCPTTSAPCLILSSSENC